MMEQTLIPEQVIPDARTALEEEFYGVEIEEADVGTDEQLYDPNRIRMRLWTPTLDLIIARIQNEEIDLAADFQRQAGIWRPGNQSRLIESLLLKIPMPAFYMRELEDEKMVVIDGIQRLTAFQNFIIRKTLRLTELEFLTKLDKVGFDELPRALQRRLTETMLTVYVIESGTPEQAQLNIFKRINTGGMTLTPQEIRHAMHPGPVRAWLRALASLEEFKDATMNSVRVDRMDDRELVARFATFCTRSYTEYSAKDLDAFISGGMAIVNRMSESERESLRLRFIRSMVAARKIFGPDAFRKRYRDRDGRKPINKALFETWAVNLDARTDEELTILEQRRETVVRKFIALMNTNEFDRAVGQSTGDPAKVRLRFEAIAAIIEQVLHPERDVT